MTHAARSGQREQDTPALARLREQWRRDFEPAAELTLKAIRFRFQVALTAKRNAARRHDSTGRRHTLRWAREQATAGTYGVDAAWLEQVRAACAESPVALANDQQTDVLHRAAALDELARTQWLTVTRADARRSAAHPAPVSSIVRARHLVAAPGAPSAGGGYSVAA